MTSHVVMVRNACFAAKTFVPTIDCARARSTAFAHAAVSSSKTCTMEVGNALTRHRVPRRDGQSFALGDARRRLKVCVTVCLTVPRNGAAFVRNGAEVCVTVPRSVRFHRGRRCQAAPKGVEQYFSGEEISEAKEVLTKVIKSGADIDETILQFGMDGRITEAVLYITQQRIKLGADMGQDPAAIEGLQLILHRMQAEFMHRHASPALLLLEQVLQMPGDDWEERAKTRLADAFRGLGPEKDEVQEAIFDIFSKAMELSRTVEEVKQSETFVSRTEFIEAVQVILSDAPRTGSKEQEDALAKVEKCLEFAKEMEQANT